MSKFPLVAIFSAISLVACVASEEPPPETSTEPQAVTQNATEALAATATLAMPFAIPPASGFDGGAVQDSIEQLMGGGLDNPSCVTFTWNRNLSAMVLFTGCTANGHTLDGTLILSATLSPEKSIRLDLEQLVYDGRSIDGFLSLSWPNQVLTIASDLTRSNGTATVHSSSNLTITKQATGIVVDGNVAVDDGGTAPRTVIVAGVTWATGDCSPSSGTLSFTIGLNNIIATFLATTPSTGTVQIQINSQPPAQVVLPILGCH